MQGAERKLLTPLHMRNWILAVLLVGLDARADTPIELWKARCMSCHAEDGSAHTKTGKKERIEDMRTAAWHAERSDEQMRKVISEGSINNRKMKPFKDKLAVDEISELIKLIRGFRIGDSALAVATPTPTPTPLSQLPPPLPASPPPQPVVLNADRPKAEVRAEPAPATPIALAPRPPSPSKAEVLAPTPEVPPQSPPVTVTVKVSEVTDDPPSEQKGSGNTWVSLLAVALSILTLIVALRRKR